ncbi:MAG: MFS transporter, partial [Proteobacteria bacterium]|nr:MFS transporter [Pseudomonadota bacterium]
MSHYSQAKAALPEVSKDTLAASWRYLLQPAVVVAALGYFVDVYDLILFGIVRRSSLEALGLSGAELLDKGVWLINMQMSGMLIGGLIWGILGDRRGRLGVLFGSILLYSLATLLNAFVTSVPQYGFLRFIAGVGLAGELGVAITLVSETLQKEHRGSATAFIAAIGISGAIAGGIVAKLIDWQGAYIVGGLMGLMLLGLRVKMSESPLYQGKEAKIASRGNFLMLWSNRSRAKRYLTTLFIGAPTNFISGLLVVLAPEITKELGVIGEVSAASAIMWSYSGLALGDLASGLLSQRLKSRRKVIILYLAAMSVFTLAYLLSSGRTPAYYYGLCFILGVTAGYWAVLITVAAEQFGTNIRATVTTTIPNFIRGLLVPLTLGL